MNSRAKGFHRLATISLAAVLSLAGLPGSSAQRTTTEDDVARAINAARDQIIVLAPTLTGKRQANGLLVAARVRGVKVYILSDTTIQGGNRVQSLSLMDGIQVRTLKNLRENTMILDNRVLVTGPEATGEGNPLEPQSTRVYTDATILKRALGAFSSLWKTAKPFTL